MSLELRPGRRVIYKSLPASIVEIAGDILVLDLGEFGITRANPSEVLPIGTPDEILGTTDIARIPNDAWDLAKKRAETIRQLLQSKTLSQHIRAAADSVGLSARQMWRLIASYRQQETVTGLVRAVPGRKQGTRVLDAGVETIIAEKIDAVHLQPERPRTKELVERVQAECRKRGLSPPAYRTIAARLDAYNDQASQRRRIGSKAAKYRYRAMPGHVEVHEALERVEIDHTPMDVMVRSDDPYCDYIGRPWLTLAIDVYTRCVLGMHIGFEPPSILSVALCLTQSVLEKSPAEEFGVPLDWPMHGMPREIVVDNGKDFTAKAFQRGCDEYGIILSYRPIGSPHYGGTIERLIGTVMGRCHLLPGTTKNSVRAKRDYDSVKHATLTLSEARRWLVEQILGGYHLRPHRTLRVPPLIAWQRAMEKRGGS